MKGEGGSKWPNEFISVPATRRKTNTPGAAPTSTPSARRSPAGADVAEYRKSKIAEAEAAALRRSGVEVQLAKFGTSMAQRCTESNAFGADVHNCVHTNAFNGKVSGTRLFCFAVPGKGYDACKAVFAELAPLTPGTSENIQANSRLYEVRTPAAPTAYVECEFHDNPETARWIVQHTTEIGEAIAKGLCKYLVPAQTEKPAPQPKGDGLFRVQVGAFANRDNAEKMLARLKKAGFTGFIAEERP